MNEFVWELVKGFMPALICVWVLVAILYLINKKNRK